MKVGTATLRSSQLFGDFLAPTDNALEDRELAPALQQGARYHRPPPAPLVVAEGIEALTRAAATANTYRSYAWVWPLAAGRPRLWQIDGLVSRSEQARAALSGDSIGYSVQAPVEELRAMEQSATVAGRRLLLVGGEAAALLFAFAVLAARSMRRDLEAARRRLTWYGARRWQLRLLTVTESAIVAVAGALIGWLVGVVVGALAASRAGAPVGAVLRESVLSPAGLAIAAGVVVLGDAGRRGRHLDAGPGREPLRACWTSPRSARSPSSSPRCSAAPPTSRGWPTARTPVWSCSSCRA